MRYLTDVPGFRACGVHAGLKPDGALDMAMIVSDRPCVAAAVFTQNLVKAAPVLYDMALLERTRDVRAVVVNSKNANAVTGEQGLRDAEEMARLTAEALALPEETGVFVMSTGVIGVPLPMNKIAYGITLATQMLDDTPEAAQAAARAIMTTDTRPKMASTTLALNETAITLAGIAKGAGMIHPNMATMLAFIVTDARITTEALDAALHDAVERSFNAISVDGDTSTNDTCLVLANGAAENTPITLESPAFAAFREALTAVCIDLAKQIAFDGEGATKHVTIHVRNAGSFEAARQIGRTIATSPLVKTALFGRDANWGRVLAAAGRAGVPFDPNRASLWFGPLQVLADGKPLPFDEEDALQILSKVDITIDLDVGGEPGDATVWTCDFSYDYVSINAEYRT